MRHRKLKLLSILLGLFLLFGMSSSFGHAQSSGGDNTEHEPENPGVKAEQVATGGQGMVVTAHPLASKVGADVLDRGGNAIDAAVAIQFALNVAEPMMSGIGGGGFMMVYDAKTEDVSIIDSRERAPNGATPDMFMDKSGNVIPFPERVQMGQAVGVPGTLKGLETALDKWGTLPLSDLIRPAIKMADQGVKVNWVLADAIESNQDKLARSAAKDVFLPEGKPLKDGDLLVQKDLAHTFRLIAEHGSDVYYNGEIGSALAQVVQQFGGSMTADDLKKYDVTEDKPLWGDYRGYDIASMPPPSSGGLTVLQLLKMFEDLNLTQYNVRSPEKYHYMTETMHLAYADRAAYMGDPEYVDVPMKGLLNPDYIKERVATIDPDKANSDVRPGNPWAYQNGKPAQVVEQNDHKVDGETTHFTVVDKWGNMVSYTTTNEQLFGTGIMVPGYGIILNNELTDFDAIPGGFNEVQPNKRPLSSMSPSMVFKDNKPFMTVGSPGGKTIIASVAQTILNVVGYGMNLKDAIEEPRIYSDAYPGISWEFGVPDNVREQLQQMGHEWESQPHEIGNVNSIMIDEDQGVYHGAADSTREGMAIGIEEPSASYMKTLVERFESEGKISNETAAHALKIHLTAVERYEHQKLATKIVKHMKGFKILLDHQKENISDDAYQILSKDADVVIEKWK